MVQRRHPHGDEAVRVVLDDLRRPVVDQLRDRHRQVGIGFVEAARRRRAQRRDVDADLVHVLDALLGIGQHRLAFGLGLGDAHPALGLGLGADVALFGGGLHHGARFLDHEMGMNIDHGGHGVSSSLLKPPPPQRPAGALLHPNMRRTAPGV